MFYDANLDEYLNNSSAVNSSGYVIAEWNMNDADNFAAIGNYRYRVTDSESPYNSLISIWDARDAGNWYTNATNNDVEVFGPFDENNDPIIFTTVDEKIKKLYSLDDCLKPHRPRSGINYLRFMGKSGDKSSTKYISGIGKNINSQVNNNSVNRPRYYLSDPSSSFKYFSSWRKENGIERGISYLNNSVYRIDDAVPFVVYKEQIPCNKLVFKMQTNVGTEDLGTITTSNGVVSDPLYGDLNSTTPRQWDIEVLKNGIWTRAYRFNESDRRSDGSLIVKPDGYVELVYGLKLPSEYGKTKYIDTFINTSLLPKTANEGDYYLIVNQEGTIGTIYLWLNDDWTVITSPEYGWFFNEDESKTYPVTDLTNPASWTVNNSVYYREFEYIEGIRIVIKTMNKNDVPFELIEMSPRLIVDLTSKTSSFRISKSMGQIDQTALPVGGLEPSTGDIEIFDYDYAFSQTNTSSIIRNHLNANISFKFYDVIYDGVEYYIIPLKTLYTENKQPQYSEICTVRYELRDAFYILENEPAPPIMIKNVSLSYAISSLLDSIGFSNYVFLNKEDSNEPIIPYFFIAPDQNVAEVLRKLSLATQSAMYFDEYNNFVVAYRDYVFDSSRSANIVLDGNSSNSNGNKQPNIADIAADEKKIYNAGTINYVERYIQRSIGSLTQANFVNADQNWIYLPALLWEVSGEDQTKTINNAVEKQSAYSLSAMPLSSDLSSTLPYVNSSRKLVNNVIDVGDSVYWLPRYKGYLYANGEIIRYDAVRFIVQGQAQPVWISSNEEYQKYFSLLPFNGKMYPDGFIRIYSEPFYEEIEGQTYLKKGAVAKHGRGQFQTEITSHFAGVSSHWRSDENVRGIRMASEFLFTTAEPPATSLGASGYSDSYNAKARTSRRTGLIKNFSRDKTYTDAQVIENTSDKSGLIQASALTIAGPNNFVINVDGTNFQDIPRDWITYINKPLNYDYKHFGTRMRIIGKLEAASDVDQNPVGSTTYYNFSGSGESLVLNGGGGGIGIGVNPQTNTGYFLELISLTNMNIADISNDVTGGHNILFYKNVRRSSGDTTKSIPIKLWGGLSEIIVDPGTLVGDQRTVGDEKTTIYDVSIEYEDFASFRRFYIFINNTQIATVDDDRPIPMYNNMCLFVRGSSHLMFENVFALRQNVSKNSTGSVVNSSQVNKAFGYNSVSSSSFTRYGISGIIKDTYIAGLAGDGVPSYNMYYEEFGTIMRECAYFDIQYDKAYPAITSQISPTLNDAPGFKVSGYQAGSYGAKFLIFNVMDKAINLDETSGNYLRIQGITFTQNTTHELSMDEYYNETSNMSDPSITDNGLVIRPPRTERDKFKTLKISRMKYGRNEWSFDSDYIQNQSAANSLMEWLSEQTTRERKLVGIDIFPNSTIQLGDVASFDYSTSGFDKISESNKKFIVYNIEYQRDASGPQMNIYVSEA